MKNTCRFYIALQVFKVLLRIITRNSVQTVILFIVFISFYISRYHLLKIFKTSLNNIRKNIFVINSLKHPLPPFQKHKSANRDKFLLMFPFFHTSWETNQIMKNKNNYFYFFLMLKKPVF